MFFVIQITAHAIHYIRQLPASGQFAVKIGFSRLGFNVFMRVEKRKQAVFYMTYDIVEIMNQKYGITQRHAVIIATTRYKQDFPGTQELFFEQVTRNTDMPLLTKISTCCSNP